MKKNYGASEVAQLAGIVLETATAPMALESWRAPRSQVIGGSDKCVCVTHIVPMNDLPMRMTYCGREIPLYVTEKIADFDFLNEYDGFFAINRNIPVVGDVQNVGDRIITSSGAYKVIGFNNDRGGSTGSWDVQ